MPTPPPFSRSKLPSSSPSSARLRRLAPSPVKVPPTPPLFFSPSRLATAPEVPDYPSPLPSPPLAVGPGPRPGLARADGEDPFEFDFAPLELAIRSEHVLESCRHVLEQSTASRHGSVDSNASVPLILDARGEFGVLAHKHRSLQGPDVPECLKEELAAWNSKADALPRKAPVAPPQLGESLHIGREQWDSEPAPPSPRHFMAHCMPKAVMVDFRDVFGGDAATSVPGPWDEKTTTTPSGSPTRPQRPRLDREVSLAKSFATFGPRRSVAPLDEDDIWSAALSGQRDYADDLSPTAQRYRSHPACDEIGPEPEPEPGSETETDLAVPEFPALPAHLRSRAFETDSPLSAPGTELVTPDSRRFERSLRRSSSDTPTQHHVELQGSHGLLLDRDQGYRTAPHSGRPELVDPFDSRFITTPKRQHYESPGKPAPIAQARRQYSVEPAVATTAPPDASRLEAKHVRPQTSSDTLPRHVRAKSAKPSTAAGRLEAPASLAPKKDQRNESDASAEESIQTQVAKALRSVDKGIQLHLVIEQAQEGFREIRTTLKYVRRIKPQYFQERERLALEEAARWCESPTRPEMFQQTGCIEFGIPPRERPKWNFHHAALEGLPVLRRLTVGDDDKHDYLPRGATLQIRDVGMYGVYGCEDKGRVEWKFEYAVTPKKSASTGEVVPHEKLMVPIGFFVSPNFFNSDRALRLHLLNVFRKTLTPNMISEKVRPRRVGNPPPPRPEDEPEDPPPAPAPTGTVSRTLGALVSAVTPSKSSASHTPPTASATASGTRTGTGTGTGAVAGAGESQGANANASNATGSANASKTPVSGRGRTLAIVEGKAAAATEGKKKEGRRRATSLFGRARPFTPPANITTIHPMPALAPIKSMSALRPQTRPSASANPHPQTHPQTHPHPHPHSHPSAQPSAASVPAPAHHKAGRLVPLHLAMSHTSQRSVSASASATFPVCPPSSARSHVHSHPFAPQVVPVPLDAAASAHAPTGTPTSSSDLGSYSKVRPGRQIIIEPSSWSGNHNQGRPSTSAEAETFGVTYGTSGFQRANATSSSAGYITPGARQ